MSGIPTLIPSSRPSEKPSKHLTQVPSNIDANISPNPTAQALASARMAAHDPLVGAPRCHQTGSSCDTGDTLIAGVGGYEQNSPNTIDSCSDQSAAIYQQDESLDRIRVNSKDGDTMTAGTMLEIHATVSTAADVSSRSHQGSETMHMYYHSQSTGTWQHICTKMSSPGVGNVTLSCDFEIPAGNYFTDCGSTCGLQMVRVNYGYAEYAIEACTETGIWVSLSLEFQLKYYMSFPSLNSNVDVNLPFAHSCRMCNTLTPMTWFFS